MISSCADEGLSSPVRAKAAAAAPLSRPAAGEPISLALNLSQEMQQRGVERNVHTFSALMNVCIKAGQYQRALSVYEEMTAVGCRANIVTYNTLIDLLGKTGQWSEALAVLERQVP